MYVFILSIAWEKSCAWENGLINRRVLLVMPLKEQKCKIKILKNGPYIISGNVPLSEKIIVSKGKINEFEDGRKFPQLEEYNLCRCGKSKNAPFCDGAHEKVGFDGTEVASRKNYFERANKQEGANLDLMDDHRCAFARFCHRGDGNVWELTENSANPIYNKPFCDAKHVSIKYSDKQ